MGLLKESKFAIKLEQKEGNVWKVIAEDKNVQPTLLELIGTCELRITTHCGEVKYV